MKKRRKKKMSSTPVVQKFKVYVFFTIPYNGVDVFPPIASVFSVDPARFEIIYKKMPNVEIRVDTRIGISCGKKGCTNCGETHFMKPASPDYEIFRESLLDWKTNVPDSEKETTGMILVKSSTVTSTATAADILRVLDDSYSELDGNLDLVYLAKWLDRPEQFNELKSYANGSKLVRTWNAHGVQALGITPRGINKLAISFDPEINPVVCRPFSQVLNILLQNGTLVGTTSTPSLLQFDSTLVADRAVAHYAADSAAKFSYLKTCECRGETHPEYPLNRRVSSDLTFFWIVVVIIVAVIAVWVLLKLGSFYSDSYHSTLSPFSTKSYDYFYPPALP